jgi:DNA-binding NtrC family response regulator
MSPTTLLLVDDHPQILQHHKNRLEALGYSVVMVSSAASAISALENTPIAAVLLEFKFEGIDAEAVANHVKARFPTQPIILLSAYAAVPERLLWLVDEYLMRSEPLEKLMAIVERLTGNEEREQIRKAAAGCNQSMPVNRSVA